MLPEQASRELDVSYNGNGVFGGALQVIEPKAEHTPTVLRP